MSETWRVPVSPGHEIIGDFERPKASIGLVVFAHGSGSSRHSPRNRSVAERLRHEGLATLLVDLLTVDEDREWAARFDIDRLSERLISAIDLAGDRCGELPLGLFGASTGAASALAGAAARPERVAAVVSRGGRPDLAGDIARAVRAPTLLIVGGADLDVVGLNRRSLPLLPESSALEIVPDATHLFEEPGALRAVADLAAAWFCRYLPGTQR